MRPPNQGYFRGLESFDEWLFHSATIRNLENRIYLSAWYMVASSFPVHVMSAFLPIEIHYILLFAT
jgi:hypothetical protein